MAHQSQTPLGSAAQKTEPKLKKRSVVSSFIFKLDGTPDRQPQVALFRRSDKVSTYKNHLAPISGSIEPSDASPLAAAWREIAEETTLDPSSLTFLRHGKPYTFCDPSIGREWTIHPFAFALKPSTEPLITIDWEHTSYSWHPPSSIPASPCVPRLTESLRRVWPELSLGPRAGATLTAGLHSLATDNVSGARQMATSALHILRDVIIAFNPCAPTPEWWSAVRMAAWHLVKNGRESMSAAIQAALLAALAAIEQRMTTPPPTPTEDFLAAVTTCIDAVLAQRTHSANALSSALSSFLTSTIPPSPTTRPLSILTLSSSSTITHALLHLTHPDTVPNLPIHIHILESRPLFEGVNLAAALTTSPPMVHITLHTDASAALAARDVDVVLLGADRIAASGAVSNKTGSLPAVLSARYVTSGRVQVVVVSDTDKIAPAAGEEEEDGGAEMVTAAWMAGGPGVKGAAERVVGEVQVRNVAFEWVAAELVDVYVTERGRWTGEDVARHAEGVEKEEGRVFGGL